MKNIWSGKAMSLFDRVPCLFICLVVFGVGFSMPLWAGMVVWIVCIFVFNLILFDEIYWNL